jgi:hypothetical protein
MLSRNEVKSSVVYDVDGLKSIIEDIIGTSGEDIVDSLVKPPNASELGPPIGFVG